MIVILPTFRGVAFALAAYALMSTMDLVAKILTRDIPPLEVAWSRYLVQFAILLPLVFLLRGGIRCQAGQGLELLRGLGMLGSSTLSIIGLSQIPLAQAAAIGFVSPVLLTVLSALLLKEKVGLERGVAVIGGFGGVLVIINPGSSFDWAALWPLASSTCWVVAMIATRKQATSGYDHLTGQFTIAVIGLIGTSLSLTTFWVTPPKHLLPIIVIYGAMSTAFHWLMAEAVRYADASLVAPTSYTQLLWSTLLGWTVLGAKPDAATLIGGLIVIMSGAYIFHHERQRSAQTLKAVA